MTAMPDSDENYIEFNIPAEDISGNQVIIRGSYVGPLGYVASINTYPFDLDTWKFTSFEATVDGNNVTLKSNSLNGEFVINLATENGSIVENSAFVVGEDGNMTGGFTSFVEGAPEFYEFASGRIAFSKGEGENQYVLSVSTRGDEWIMVGETGAYKIEAKDYNVTINFPAAEALSVDGKRWQLPSDIAEMVAGMPTAVLVVDLGVSAPGQLMVIADYESIYGAQAAGMWAPMIAVAYTVEATDATSGKILLQQTDHFGDIQTTEIPYTNLTADSVTIDFTNMLGMPGANPCTLYTGEVNLQGGGVM
jgi:hypothetical protein